MMMETMKGIMMMAPVLLFDNARISYCPDLESTTIQFIIDFYKLDYGLLLRIGVN